MGLFRKPTGRQPGVEVPTVGDAIAVALAPPRAPVWARPNRCPACNGKGFLDRIDVLDRIQYEHCTECGHKWTVTERETVRI